MHRLFVCLALATCLAAVEDAGPVAFATWSGDPCTTLSVRILAPTVPARVSVRGSDGGERVLPLTTRPVGGTGWVVVQADAEGLPPGSAWTAEADGVILGRFRTLRGEPPLRFATGGDLLHQTSWLRATTMRMAAEAPAFALIGGDWAYDNAQEKDFARWVDLWRIWAAATTPEGFAIPVVAGIGNHELGRGVPLERTPFHAFFPEPTCRAFDIGGWLSVMLLDSGHARPIEAQVSWLEQALATRGDRAWRFALYHVPAYPAVRLPEEATPTRVRQLWVPLFERFGVAACFENHDHALKRTHPLLGGRPAAGGITYLGDGCWGVAPRETADPRQRAYLAHSAARHHAWIIDLERDRGTARAVAPDGIELDRCELAPRRPSAP